MTNLLRQAVVPSHESYRLIPLTRGQFAVVDAADFEWLSQWQWCVRGNDKAGYYAVRHEGSSVVQMHRVILHAPRHRRGDHWNGDSLDNRRCNLRLTTQKINAQNARISRNNSSGCTGVCRAREKWHAFITVRGKRKNWYFDSHAEAIAKRKWAEKRYYGEIIRESCPSRILITQEMKDAALAMRVPRVNMAASGYTGITYHRGTSKWMAKVYRNKTTYYLGLFDTAALAHDAHKRKLAELG